MRRKNSETITFQKIYNGHSGYFNYYVLKIRRTGKVKSYYFKTKEQAEEFLTNFLRNEFISAAYELSLNG
jgi:hypothetical protein